MTGPRLRYAGGDQAHPGEALELLSGMVMPMTADQVQRAVDDQGERPDVPAAVRYGRRHGILFGVRDPYDFVADFLVRRSR